MASLTLGSAVLSRHKPLSWTSLNLSMRDMEVLELPECSSEFISAKGKIRRRLLVNVDRVFRVENQFLYGCYLLKKEEYIKRYGCCREIELFHATDICHIPSITIDNLDWRRSVRTKFGSGVSFSPDAAYANLHCNRSNPARRAMIIADVLVHSTCYGSPAMKLPTRNADTSTGNSGSVYVKFSDKEFYPKYVAYYTKL